MLKWYLERSTLEQMGICVAVGALLGAIIF